MAEYTLDDMISSVIEKKPETFKAAFNDLMAQKALDAVEAKKQEVAQTMFNDNQEQSPEEGEQEYSNEQDDLEIEDENVDNS